MPQLLSWAQFCYTKIAQRIFKYSDIQYTSLTLDKKLNSIICRTLFCINTYDSYKLSRNRPVFRPTLYTCFHHSTAWTFTVQSIAAWKCGLRQEKVVAWRTERQVPVVCLVHMCPPDNGQDTTHHQLYKDKHRDTQISVTGKSQSRLEFKSRFGRFLGVIWQLSLIHISEPTRPY